MAFGFRFEHAHRQTRHVVDAIDLIERELLQEAVGHHRQRTFPPFLRRLEDEANGAIETAFLGQRANRNPLDHPYHPQQLVERIKRLRRP